MNEDLKSLRDVKTILLKESKELIDNVLENKRQLSENELSDLMVKLNELYRLDEAIDHRQKLSVYNETRHFDNLVTPGIRRRSKALSTNHLRLVNALRNFNKPNKKLKRVESLQNYKKSSFEVRSEKTDSLQKRLPRYSFNTFLPFRVTEEALQHIRDLVPERTRLSIVFPDTFKQNEKVYYKTAAGDRRSFAVVIVEIEDDPQSANLKHHGIILRKAQTGELLEFVIKYPATPTSVVSSQSKNQGDFSYRLNG